MQAFVVIIGIVTLLAFFIQLRDLFPAHRETRKTLLVFIFGVFVGSVISVVQGVTITLDIPSSPVLLLLYTCIIILILLLLIAAMTWLLSTNEKSKSHAGEFLIIGIVVLLFMFLGAGAGSAIPSNDSSVGLEEYLTLGNNYSKKSNYEKSLYFLNKAKSMLSRGDPRYELIDEKIEAIKLKQVESTFQ